MCYRQGARLRGGRSVRLPTAGSLSLSVRESNQREAGTPSTRFAGVARKVRGGITGFFDSTSCADEKRADIHEALLALACALLCWNALERHGT